MSIENLCIKRNHFEDYMVEGNGLYLTGRDYMFLPLSDIKMSAISDASNANAYVVGTFMGFLETNV